MGYGFLIRDGKRLVYEHSSMEEPSDDNSVNVAEYTAMALGLEWVGENMRDLVRERGLLVLGDSRIATNGMRRGCGSSGLCYEASQRALTAHERIKDSRITYKWIPREKNQKADELSGRALREAGIYTVAERVKLNLPEEAEVQPTVYIDAVDITRSPFTIVEPWRPLLDDLIKAGWELRINQAFRPVSDPKEAKKLRGRVNNLYPMTSFPLPHSKIDPRPWVPDSSSRVLFLDEASEGIPLSDDGQLAWEVIRQQLQQAKLIGVSPVVLTKWERWSNGEPVVVYPATIIARGWRSEAIDKFLTPAKEFWGRKGEVIRGYWLKDVIEAEQSPAFQKTL